MIVGGELAAVYSYVIAERKTQALVHTPIRAHAMPSGAVPPAAVGFAARP